MAACRPTRKPSATPASSATDENGKPFLSREVLGGGSGGRYYADGNDAIHIVPDSRNQPAEFTETRFPLLVEKLALRTDSGGAGKRRGGLGYEKHYRALVDCRTIVTADRVRLGCYGVNGGKAGQPFCVTVDALGAGTDLGGLVDGEPVLAGPDRARGDDRRRRLGRSAGARAGAGAARRDRGQGVGGGCARRLRCGADWRRLSRSTRPQRPSCAQDMQAKRDRSPAMIDRGPGYDVMLSGQAKPRMKAGV